MSDHPGEKTEQATPRRLEEALQRGQFARSAEVQTAFVLGSGALALWFSGPEIIRGLGLAMISTLGHLHEIPLKFEGMQRFAIDSSLLLGRSLGPIAVATAIGALLAGGIQSHFRMAPDALTMLWERISPMEGWRRLFSLRTVVPTFVGAAKLTVVAALSYSVVKEILSDPIFFSSVDVRRIGVFLTDSSFKIILRIGFALAVLAAVDYGYQLWRTTQDLMMTKEEVKEEAKSQEGNPQIKAARRRRRQATTQRKMLAAVPKADVVVTNPTHLAVALRYDGKSMRAPKMVAKGSRYNALRIREIAKQHQVPVLENKPLARLLFKYGRVGSEIPAQLYAAVAEILAYVYRVNAYRYYRERQEASATS